MNTNRKRNVWDAVVEKAIGAAYEVSNTLGAGFLEKVYERALIRELALRGLAVRSQVSVLRRL
jgi:GxxExxY protein